MAYQRRGAVSSVVLRMNESLPELLKRLDRAVARLESDDGAEPANEAGVQGKRGQREYPLNLETFLMPGNGVRYTYRCLIRRAE